MSKPIYLFLIIFLCACSNNSVTAADNGNPGNDTATTNDNAKTDSSDNSVGNDTGVDIEKADSDNASQNETAPDLDGVDRYEYLFAPAKKEEISAVEADWDKRNPGTEGFKIEKKIQESAYSIYIVSHIVDGYRHYGAVQIPAGASAQNPLPVLVNFHGGIDGFNVTDLLNTFLQYTKDPEFSMKFVTIMPCFRSETLNAGDAGTFKSEGPASELDRDADDVIGLIEAVGANMPEADIKNTALFAISRGSSVAMHVALRARNIKGIVELYGSTDYLLDSLKQSVKNAAAGSAIDNAITGRVMRAVITPLDQAAITLEEGRRRLVEYSSVYFAYRFPRLQIHHGEKDADVPFEHATRLKAVLSQPENANVDWAFYSYTDGIHSMDSIPDSAPRVMQFLKEVLSLP